MRHYLNWNIHLICISQKLLEPVMHKLHCYQFTGWCLTEFTLWVFSSFETIYVDCDTISIKRVNLEGQSSAAIKGQCLATLDGDSWIKRERWGPCMGVRVCRLIKWNQNEKPVKWPGNKIPIFFFVFLCPVEVQFYRENTYLQCRDKQCGSPYLTQIRIED